MILKYGPINIPNKKYHIYKYKDIYSDPEYFYIENGKEVEVTDKKIIDALLKEEESSNSIEYCYHNSTEDLKKIDSLGLNLENLKSLIDEVNVMINENFNNNIAEFCKVYRIYGLFTIIKNLLDPNFGFDNINQSSLDEIKKFKQACYFLKRIEIDSKQEKNINILISDIDEINFSSKNNDIFEL